VDLKCEIELSTGGRAIRGSRLRESAVCSPCATLGRWGFQCDATERGGSSVRDKG